MLRNYRTLAHKFFSGKRLKASSLALVLLTLSNASVASAGEWEDGMKVLDGCWSELKLDYQALPDVQTGKYEDVLKAYDNLPEANYCSQAALLAIAEYEEIGYLNIIEYRNDLHDRRKAWKNVEKVAADWRERVLAERDDVNREILRRNQEKARQLKRRDYSDMRLEWIQKNRQCRMDAYDKHGSGDKGQKAAKTCSDNIVIAEYE